ncbi:MAG: allantoinase [Polyangiales bacterium]|jgi:allantoinase
MTKRFALRSQRVLTPQGIKPQTIIVNNGRIESMQPADAETTLAEGLELEDLGDSLVFPGLVDCHVHINEPGRTEWEGFETATKAAASGGVTTVIDMPLNCTPVTTSVDALKLKLDATSGRLHVDTGFWGGVIPGNAEELTRLAEAGALGAKAFLCPSGIDDFPHSTEDDLRKAMPRLAEAGIPLLAHAELELDAPVCPPGSTDYKAYLESRPPEWEDSAIRMLIKLCRETGCPVHIVHLSSASAVPMLREAKAEGLPITVETCPHYLCLTAEEIPAGDTTFKCAPPIRENANRNGLWDALIEGVIDFVISDHSPCTPGLKRIDEGDFAGAWGGIASLSLGLSSVWTEGQKRGVKIEKLAEWMSLAPARFAGVADKKGAIAEGMHADFFVWDPDKKFEVDAERLHFRHRVSPYVGRSLHGEVQTTWLRGNKIFERDTFAKPMGEALLHRGSEPETGNTP